MSRGDGVTPAGSDVSWLLAGVSQREALSQETGG